MTMPAWILKYSASLQSALGRLIRCHVLQRAEGELNFEVTLMERWVRERVGI